MTTFREAIPDFQFANPVYAGATVSFYTVDAFGASTGTLATIYSNPLGTITTNNPQILDADGKFYAPVYISVAVIAHAVGPNVASHSTGVIGEASVVNFTTAAKLTVTGLATTDVPLTVVGVASQSGDLQQWKNSAGTVKATITKDGIAGFGTSTPGAHAATSGYPFVNAGVDVGGIILLHPQQEAIYIYGGFGSTAYFEDTTSTSHGWAAGLVGANTYGLLYTTHAFSATPPFDTLTTGGMTWTPNWVYAQPPAVSTGVSPSWNRGVAIGYGFGTVGATNFLNRNQSLGTTEFVFSGWNDVVAADIVFMRSAGANLDVRAQNATDIPLLLRGASAQSAALQVWQNSSASTLAQITKDGYFTIANGINLTVGGGAAVVNGLFGDGTNIALRTPAKIYFQNSSGVGTFGDFDATRFDIANTTASTNTTSGALTVAGGLGVVKKAFFGDNVDVASGKVYTVAGTQVLGARITGYAPMTGTPNKAAVYDTSTVTLAQLAGRVAQMQADWTTHGSIGA